MDYYEWVESQRGKASTVVDWDSIPAETVADPNMSTHTGTVRKTWVGDNLVLTRVIVRANSCGKPHSHAAEQVSMILRGGAKVTTSSASPGSLATQSPACTSRLSLIHI